VLVMIRSKSVSICNHSRARLVDSSRNRTFSRGYPNLMRSYRGLLETMGTRAVNPYTVEIYVSCRTFHMQVVLVYLEWFRRNSLLKCVMQSKMAKNLLKTPILGFKIVQGHRCWYHWKARRQCLQWYSSSLCLSATVFTLDEPIVVK